MRMEKRDKKRERREEGRYSFKNLLYKFKKRKFCLCNLFVPILARQKCFVKNSSKKEKAEQQQQKTELILDCSIPRR